MNARQAMGLGLSRPTDLLEAGDNGSGRNVGVVHVGSGSANGEAAARRKEGSRWPIASE